MQEWITVLWGKTSIDPLAFFISGVALWLAWKAYRNSPRHKVKLIDFHCSVVDYGQQHPSPTIEATILGCGLPIHQMTVEFQYQSKIFGTVSLAMSQVRSGRGGRLEPVDTAIPFEPGMRGKFQFERRIVPGVTGNAQLQGEELYNARKQRAAIVIESNGFEIQRFRLGRRRDLLMFPLVSMLQWIGRKFTWIAPRQIWLWESKLIPRNYGFQVECFGKAIRDSITEVRMSTDCER